MCSICRSVIAVVPFWEYILLVSVNNGQTVPQLDTPLRPFDMPVAGIRPFLVTCKLLGMSEAVIDSSATPTRSDMLDVNKGW